jgi:subtilisin
MRRRLVVGGLLAALVVSLVAAAPAVAAPRQASGGYIVVLNGSANPAVMARRHGARVRHLYRHALKGYSTNLTADQAARLRAEPDVAAVVAEQTFRISAQTLPTGIDRVDGELSSAQSGNGSGEVGVDIAVIDTGIDLDHPDLNARNGVNCVSPGAPAEDDHGHGTHVAGTAAARDNDLGVVGVAPGARVWAVKVLNAAGSGTTSQIVCGIDWVTANAQTGAGIEVANMSLGGQSLFGSFSTCGSTWDPMHPAICRSVSAGVTYAVAAGNSAANANNFVPATYAEVITVSALADFNGQPGGGAPATCRADEDDTFASFSNYGGDVDLIAPGVCILSTYLGGGYTTLSGTSMASPHVAGAAGLYKAGNPGATPAQVRAALQAAGNLNWNDADDPDPTKERLLNVDAI